MGGRKKFKIRTSGNREYDSADSGGPSNTLASGNQEYVQKVVQNMRDRLRPDENTR